jgi:hypothetical protein
MRARAHTQCTHTHTHTHTHTRTPYLVCVRDFEDFEHALRNDAAGGNSQKSVSKYMMYMMVSGLVYLTDTT